MLTVGSCFSGIGGLDLGLERSGMEIRWQVENDAYCNEILADHWPSVVKYGDIREISGEELERVDLICGGFPCQDLSAVGRRAGIHGSKSSLFFEFMRIIREVRPEYIVLENVPRALSIGGGRDAGIIFGEVAEAGYDCWWGCLSASDFGAPHGRERLLVVAHSEGGGLQAGKDLDGKTPDGVRGHNALGRRAALGDELFGRTEGSSTWDAGVVERSRLVKPGVCPVAPGVPGRVARIRAIGNSLVPCIAEHLGRCILRFHEVMKNG